MRIGKHPCAIKEGTVMAAAYGADETSERHRHRYEFNNGYREIFEENGMIISGTSPDGNVVETMEIAQNGFFVGTAFNPEFKSRPNRPHPLFIKFIETIMGRV
jgi:CTP synthase